jgi:hypothetical protein
MNYSDDLDEIEEELKEDLEKEDKTHHKVSGKSVLEIQEIIKNKADELKKEKS